MRICFHQKVKILISGKKSKSAATNLLNLQQIERYLWKMISISFIWHPKVWNMPNGRVKMAQGKSRPHAKSGQMQKVSDTSISSSLSLGRYILLKENAGARRAIGLKACNKKLTLTALQENLVLSSQWSLLEGSLAPKLANILTSVKLLTFKVFNNPTKISILLTFTVALFNPNRGCFSPKMTLPNAIT